MHFTIFYAWQSDRPEKLSKYFIKKATEAAITAIRADAELDLAPSLDHDTKDVPGIPDIPSTICDKIDRCGIFLADMTFSGVTQPQDPEKKPKFLPNPNVLIELGYALARLGPNRIIYVMNTAFGGAEELPFDIRVRRHPICYRLEDAKAPDRTEIQRQLALKLEDAIKTIIKSGVLDENEDEELLPRIAAEREAFEASASSGLFQNVAARPGIVALSVIPARKADPPLNPVEIWKRIKFSPLSSGGCNPYYSGKALILENSTPGYPAWAALEMHDTGAIYTVSTELFNHRGGIYEPSMAGTQMDGAVPSVAFEKELIQSAVEYINGVRELGLGSDLYIGIALLNVRNTTMAVDPAAFRRRLRLFTREHIKPDLIRVPTSTISVDFQDTASLLRPAFDFIWREYGHERSFNYDARGAWVGSR